MRINAQTFTPYQAHFYNAPIRNFETNPRQNSSQVEIGFTQKPDHKFIHQSSKLEQSDLPITNSKQTWDDVYQKVDDIISKTFDSGLNNSPNKLWDQAYEEIFGILEQASMAQEAITASSKNDPSFDPEYHFVLSPDWQEIIDKGLLPKAEGTGYRYLTNYYDDLLSHVLFINLSDTK